MTRGIVLRAIIHDHELHTASDGIGRKHRLEALIEEARVVVGRDDDGEAGRPGRPVWWVVCGDPIRTIGRPVFLAGRDSQANGFTPPFSAVRFVLSGITRLCATQDRPAALSRRQTAVGQIVAGLPDGREPFRFLEQPVADPSEIVQGRHDEVGTVDKRRGRAAVLRHQDAAVGEGEQRTVALEIDPLVRVNIEDDLRVTKQGRSLGTRVVTGRVGSAWSRDVDKQKSVVVTPEEIRVCAKELLPAVRRVSQKQDIDRPDRHGGRVRLRRSPQDPERGVFRVESPSAKFGNAFGADVKDPLAEPCIVPGAFEPGTTWLLDVQYVDRSCGALQLLRLETRL